MQPEIAGSLKCPTNSSVLAAWRKVEAIRRLALRIWLVSIICQILRAVAGGGLISDIIVKDISELDPLLQELVSPARCLIAAIPILFYSIFFTQKFPKIYSYSSWLSLLSSTLSFLPRSSTSSLFLPESRTLRSALMESFAHYPHVPRALSPQPFRSNKGSSSGPQI